MTTKPTDFPFGVNNKPQALCMVLDAIEKIDQDMADYRDEYKKARENLWAEVRRLKTEIRSGQMNLLDVAEKVAEQVNAGMLDKDGIRVTAQVRDGKSQATGD